MTPYALQPSAVAALLLSAAAVILAELSALPAPALGFHPAEGEWCAKEVLGHLIECEKRGFSGRIHVIMQTEGSPQLEGWDQDAVARARKDCEREWPALYDEFSKLRSASVAQVGGLSPEGAATIAAVRRMVREGQLGPTSRVVVFNTATGLRYPHLMDGPVPVIPGAGVIDEAAVARAGRAIGGGRA